MSAPMIHPSPQPDAGYEYPPPGGSSYAYSEVAPMIHHSGHRPNASFDSRATGGVRTPSPTPSELAFIQRKGAFNIDRANIRKYFSKDYIGTWIALAIGIAITVLTIVFHDDIIGWLKPTGEKIKALPAGFLIPIAIFIVVSFPPLFGHELIAVVVGVIWGLGVGFAIVAAGTLAGEIISFLAFRYMCGARIEKSARKNLKFGVLMHVIRESGWRIILIARLSAIPPHFTTVVFAVCRTNLLVFTLTAIATLPRQFATVYLGVLADNASTSGTKQTTGQRILSGVVIGVTVIITIYAMRYIEKKIDEAKPAFIYARRKERAGLEGDEDRAFDARDDVEDGSLNAPYDPAPYRTPSPMMRATENNAPYDSTPYSNAPYDAPLPTRTAEDAPFAAPPPPTFHVSSH